MRGKYRPSKGFIPFFIVAIGLFLIAIIFQVTQDLIQNFYITELTPISLTTGKLHILVPRRLSEHPEETLGLPFILSVRDFPSPPDPVEYRITLETDSTVFIKNKEGDFLEEIVLTISGENTNVVADLYLQTVPYRIISDKSSSFTLKIWDGEQRITKEFSIPIETRGQAALRYLFTRVLGQTAIILSIIVAVGGWFGDYLNRQQKWQEKLQQFEELNVKEPLQALHFLQRTLSSEMTVKQIPFVVLGNFIKHGNYIVENPQTILIEVNRLFYLGEDSQAQEALKAFSQFLNLENVLKVKPEKLEISGEVTAQLSEASEAKAQLQTSPKVEVSKLRRCIMVLSQHFEKKHNVVNKEEVEEISKQALWLWKKYDLDVREIVVQALALLRKVSSNDETLNDAFCKSGNANDRRLLNDIRLREIAPEESITLRKWPPISIPNSSEIPEEYENAVKNKNKDGENEDSVKNKDKNEEKKMLCLPFSKTFPDKDDLLYKVECRPVDWTKYEDKSSCRVFLTDKPRDQQAVLIMLAQKRHTESLQIIFGVSCRLPFSELWQTDEVGEYLVILAYYIAKEWMRLLAYFPQDFLDMPRDEQIKLAEFLVWAAGSREALSVQLHQACIKRSLTQKSEERESNRGNNADSTASPPEEAVPTTSDRGKTCEKPLKDSNREDTFAAYRVLYYLLSEISNIEQLVNPPSFSRLTNWLLLRPLECEKIELVIQLSVAGPRDRAFQQLLIILGMREQLEVLGIILKVFLVIDSKKVKSCKKILSRTLDKDLITPILWDTVSLKDHIQGRLDKAFKEGDPNRELRYLLDSKKENLADQYVEKAKGSLSELIDICADALEERLTGSKQDNQQIKTLSLLQKI